LKIRSERNRTIFFIMIHPEFFTISEIVLLRTIISPGSTFAIFTPPHRPRKSTGAVPSRDPRPGHSPGAGGDAVSDRTL
jgi:hypothetical protein